MTQKPKAQTPKVITTVHRPATAKEAGRETAIPKVTAAPKRAPSANSSPESAGPKVTPKAPPKK